MRFSIPLYLYLALALLVARPMAHSAPALEPGPLDGVIARRSAQILEQLHFLQQPLNDEISSRFLDRYLTVLDPQRFYFLQTDVEEFEVYRHKLDDLILREGDVSSAHQIFNRYLQRLEQQSEHVSKLLEEEQFEFTGDEKFLLNRRKAPRPKDLEEARQLWRERLRHEYLQEKLNQTNPEEIVNIIKRRYARILKSFLDFDSDEVLQVFLSSLTHAYDPHSDYMGKSELDRFTIGMKLSLFGIGALLRSEDGYCKIVQLIPGGPAERSKKLKPEDRIIAVAQGEAEPVDVVDMKLGKVVEMIRGPKDSEVRLTVIPADASDPSVRQVVSLVRDEVKLEDQEAKAKIYEVPDGKDRTLRLGLIDLPSFYADFSEDRKGGNRKSTTTDVSRLLEKLKAEKVDGIILDLRRNGGGSLEESVNLTGLFIKKGPVVLVKDSFGKVIKNEDEDPSVLYDGPLIVLTSRFSASASEILAGALQDYGRALIVGESATHGKGTVQTLLELAPYMRGVSPDEGFNPGAVKVTIRKFYRPSGASTQKRGVIPDLQMPSINSHAEVGESSLDNPLEWDTIPSVRFEKSDRLQGVVEELNRRSERRIAEDQDFGYVREDIEQFQKMMADRSVSLNETQRRAEKEEAEARAKARREEIAARAEPPHKTFELSLKQVNLPGLPPPVAETNLAQVEHAEKPLATDDDSADEEKAPAIDVGLKEAKRILVDLIHLLGTQETVAARK